MRILSTTLPPRLAYMQIYLDLHDILSCLTCTFFVACRELFESLYLRKLRYSQELDGPSCVGFLETLTTQGAMQVRRIFSVCAVMVYGPHCDLRSLVSDETLQTSKLV